MIIMMVNEIIIVIDIRMVIMRMLLDLGFIKVVVLEVRILMLRVVGVDSIGCFILDIRIFSLKEVLILFFRLRFRNICFLFGCKLKCLELFFLIIL